MSCEIIHFCRPFVGEAFFKSLLGTRYLYGSSAVSLLPVTLPQVNSDEDDLEKDAFRSDLTPQGSSFR